MNDKKHERYKYDVTLTVLESHTCQLRRVTILMEAVQLPDQKQICEDNAVVRSQNQQNQKHRQFLQIFAVLAVVKSYFAVDRPEFIGRRLT